MNEKRDFLDALNDIVLESKMARSFVADVEFDAFVANPEKVRAVVRSLEIIGEAARGVPESIRSRYPQVAWREMAGMRDKLIHGYRSVNLRRVWDTVLQDLPPWKPPSNKSWMICKQSATNEPPTARYDLL